MAIGEIKFDNTDQYITSIECCYSKHEIVWTRCYSENSSYNISDSDINGSCILSSKRLVYQKTLYILQS